MFMTKMDLKGIDEIQSVQNNTDGTTAFYVYK